MNKDIANKWVAALRSGKYQQTTGQLRRDATDPDVVTGEYPSGHCCLGVLCEVLDARYDRTDGGVSGHVEIESEMRDPCGMPREGKIKIGGDEYADLTLANDHGVPFVQIADWIEANYEKL